MDKDKKILGLKPNVFWLGIVSLFNDFSGEMVYSVMPGFLTAVFGAPPILIGFLEGFADALASFFKIYFGWVSDKIRKRKILSVIGYSISASTRWFLALTGNFWQVFILRPVDRVGPGGPEQCKPRCAQQPDASRSAAAAHQRMLPVSAANKPSAIERTQ